MSGTGIKSGGFFAELGESCGEFSFEGKFKVYNPKAVLECLKEKEFREYWPSEEAKAMLDDYAKRGKIEEVSRYRDISVDRSFVRQTIEEGTPEYFLSQVGFLTVKEERRCGYLGSSSWILDYPNQASFNAVEEESIIGTD